MSSHFRQCTEKFCNVHQSDILYFVKVKAWRRQKHMVNVALILGLRLPQGVHYAMNRTWYARMIRSACRPNQKSSNVVFYGHIVFHRWRPSLPHQYDATAGLARKTARYRIFTGKYSDDQQNVSADVQNEQHQFAYQKSLGNIGQCKTKNARVCSEV